MKILFLCHRLPYPPNRGGRIRPFHILAHLSRSHDVTLAAPLRTGDGAVAVEALRAFSPQPILAPTGELASWSRTVLRLPTTRPSSFAYFDAPGLARALRCALDAAPDLVLVHASSMAPYVAGARAATLLDFGDMSSEKWRAYGRRRPLPAALGYRWEAWKVRRAEVQLARRFDLCTCTTQAELETLESYGAARRTGWFPNGVDAEYFHPADEPYDPDTICFLGQMGYYPNQEAVIWFCDHVLPALRVRRPALRFCIVGAEPSRAVRRLAERPGVRVTGTVPDVRPYARRAALSVAPLQIARGTQNKILESLAMGVPVVASPLAARGTAARPGEDLLTASDPKTFAAAILRLLDDPAERRRLGEAGRALVRARHDWAASMRRLDALIEGCLADRRARRRRESGLESAGSQHGPAA